MSTEIISIAPARMLATCDGLSGVHANGCPEAARRGQAADIDISVGGARAGFYLINPEHDHPFGLSYLKFLHAGRGTIQDIYGVSFNAHGLGHENGTARREINFPAMPRAAQNLPFAFKDKLVGLLRGVQAQQAAGAERGSAMRAEVAQGKIASIGQAENSDAAARYLY